MSPEMQQSFHSRLEVSPLIDPTTFAILSEIRDVYGDWFGRWIAYDRTLQKYILVLDSSPNIGSHQVWVTIDAGEEAVALARYLLEEMHKW